MAKGLQGVRWYVVVHLVVVHCVLCDCAGDNMCCSGGLPCVDWMGCGDVGVAGAGIGVVMLQLREGD